MKTTAYRIVDNHNNKIEELMRLLMSILSIRGTSFIHHETNENGNELLIFIDKETLIRYIYEANDFIIVSCETMNHLINLVRNKEYTSIVEIEYNIYISKKLYTREGAAYNIMKSVKL